MSLTPLVCFAPCALQLVDDQFQGNSLFQKAMKDAFELVVNKVRLPLLPCSVWLHLGGAPLADRRHRPALLVCFAGRE